MIVRAICGYCKTRITLTWKGPDDGKPRSIPLDCPECFFPNVLTNHDGPPPLPAGMTQQSIFDGPTA